MGEVEEEAAIGNVEGRGERERGGKVEGRGGRESGGKRNRGPDASIGLMLNPVGG